IFCGVYLGFPPMNTIDGTLEKKGKEVILSAPSSIGTINLTDLRFDLPSERFEVTIGIRPEHLYIHQEKKSDADVTLQGEIVIGEVIGSDTILHMKIGNTLLKSFVPKIERLIPGSKAFVSFNLENVYFFKKDTGERIS
ncbi:MAG: TOBE domain-containing protein, partial [Spirochaetota bacterium]